jgi:leader peptidase (prepilin peptidase)/N-methyltransferase
MIGLRDRAVCGPRLPVETDATTDAVHLASARTMSVASTRREAIRRAAIAGVGCAMAILSLAAAPGGAGLFGCALALLMIAIAIVDARRYIIPDQLTIAAFLLALAYASSQSLGSASESVIIAASRGVVLSLAFLGLREIYRRLRKRQGIGLGDVKLAAVAGAWLEWTFVPVAIEIAALSALAVYGVGRLFAHRPLRASARLPFGLFLAPAIWFCWLLEAKFGEF